MQICFRDANKIPTGKRYEVYASPPPPDGPWFELVHFEGPQQLNDARLRACLDREGAVLLFSGSGFTRELAESIESGFPLQNLHCLRVPYSQADPLPALLELLTFVGGLDRVSADKPVRWNTLYPSSSDVLSLLPAAVSYQQEFDRLWMLDIPASSTVIVWDGMPPQPRRDGPNLLPYLTPLDWAAATCLKHPEARWSLFLVDCASRSFPSPALKLYGELPGLLPHVRVYESHEAARLLRDIKTSPPSPPPPVR